MGYACTSILSLTRHTQPSKTHPQHTCTNNHTHTSSGLQAAAEEGEEALSDSTDKLAAQIQPAASAAGQTLVKAAEKVQQGATQQGQELAGRIEEAGQVLGESDTVVVGWCGSVRLGVCV